MYCQPSDIRPVVPSKKLRSVLGLEGAGEIPEIELTPFIVLADSEIDTELGHRYTVPITGSQSLAILKSISIALSIQSAYETAADKVPEKVLERIDRARLILSEYASGARTLPDASARQGFDYEDSDTCEYNGVLLID